MAASMPPRVRSHTGIRVVQELVLAALGVIAITASSWVALPVGPVPVTLQTLVVLLIGASYGTLRAACTVGAWLVLGALGAPVFAGGSGGVAPLVGKTGGYLVAFVPAAMLVAGLSERGPLRRPVPAFLVLALAHGLILAIGAAWLASFIGGPAAWSYGVAPFLLGGALKSALAAALLDSTRRLLARWTLKPDLTRTRMQRGLR